ncbi:uncharacterized protein N7515_008694 [Penicillium bovifimosum]|uniref:Uncharacterized protein n=1 Tax=Penicillium bovifimosum TaxID=126998 RepID=A0A9W9KWL8_9EURO|nr:uncharacterized protein N7515_008694 [Penicillium bovifimosum]KAJ5124869.1 hypothetical protein N7515_008694 [Penicillium bovifimosum]
MPFPFETSPFYQRPFLIAWTCIHNLFTITVFAVIPILAGLAIVLGICFIVFAILAGVFKWELGSKEDKARRRKEREEKERAEGKMSNAEQTSTVLSVESEASGGLGSGGGAIDVAALDAKARLEIELELLAEMVAIRRERLENMK